MFSERLYNDYRYSITVQYDACPRCESNDNSTAKYPWAIFDV